jgi:hypothetical protein
VGLDLTAENINLAMVVLPHTSKLSTEWAMALDRNKSTTAPLIIPTV